MVAKTFQTMTILCEPYKSNNKMYVNVRNEKTGTVRTVRWYTETEYKRMYPEAKAAVSTFKNLREALGFNKGYITIFKDTAKEAYQETFRKSNARYHVIWGWYVVSTEELGALDKKTHTQLMWDEVSINGSLKSESTIKKIIKEKWT